MDTTKHLARRAEAFIGQILSPALNVVAQAPQAAFFLYVSLAASGLVLFFYYPAESGPAYETLDRFSKNVSFGGTSRSIHRLAADLTALFAVIHMFRAFFLKRFTLGRGLSWISGAALLIFIGWQGVSGYTLALDERSEAIIRSATPALMKFAGVEAGRAFLVNEEITPRTMILLLAAHLVPPVLALALFAGHWRRLKTPRLWPSHGLMAAMTAGLFAAALTAPAGSLAKADFFTASGPVPFDRLLMWPVHPGMGTAAWVGGGICFMVLLLIPAFISEKKETVRLHHERCAGCGLCAADCPYKAIVMEPLPAHSHHPWVAAIDGSKCAGCAVCCGSCGFNALEMPSRPLAGIRGEARNYIQTGGGKIAYRCQHAQNYGASGAGEAKIIKLICASQLHPRWIEEDLKNGATMVTIAACQPFSCESRLGSAFARARFDHLRKPYLRKKVDRSRVGYSASEESARNRFLAGARWAVVSLLFLSMPILLSHYWQNRPLALENRSNARIAVSMNIHGESSIAVTADGRTVFEKTWRAAPPGEARAVFEEIILSPSSGTVKTVYSKPGVEKIFSIDRLEAGETAVIRQNPDTAELELLRRR